MLIFLVNPALEARKNGGRGRRIAVTSQPAWATVLREREERGEGERVEQSEKGREWERVWILFPVSVPFTYEATWM